MRYARAVTGISQQELADALHVAVRTVKRWEHPGQAEPPADVLEWLRRAVDAHERDVHDAVDGALQQRLGGRDTLFLDWYRNQGQADLGGQGVPVGYANAVTRDAARKLADLGANVAIRFPGEEVQHMQRMD